MKVRLLTLALMLGLGCGAASAHGNKVHVRGTVEKVGADSVQVKTQDGKTVEVKLVASTAYVLHVNDKMAGDTLYQPGKGGIRRLDGGDKPATASDLAVGDLVVIHATPRGNRLEADEVKFSSPPKPKS